MTESLNSAVTESDYWRLRAFLREVYLRNGRREHSWHVGDLDHWRWHLVENCGFCPSFEQGTLLWEDGGEILAAVTDSGGGEIRLHVDSVRRSPALENAMLTVAEERFAGMENGQRFLYLPVREDDVLRQRVLGARGYVARDGTSRQWQLDLTHDLPEVLVPARYSVRAMGPIAEHSARSLASWRAFHDEEPADVYDGDWSWIANVQRGPLYRRDLDVVAATGSGEIASFVTVLYDDVTRSGLCVLVGTAAEHRRRGLGRATLLEAAHRVRNVGGTLLSVTGYDERANAFYGTLFDRCDVQRTWLHVLQVDE